MADQSEVGEKVQEKGITKTGKEQAKESGINGGKAEQTGRSYQVELMEHALAQNTIVNLGTGAGKTFVAVMTIKEMASQTMSLFTDSSGQRTVFLAMTGKITTLIEPIYIII